MAGSRSHTNQQPKERIEFFRDATASEGGRTALNLVFLILRGRQHLTFLAGNIWMEDCFPSRAAFSH